jgi:hypothetical protein
VICALHSYGLLFFGGIGRAASSGRAVTEAMHNTAVRVDGELIVVYGGPPSTWRNFLAWCGQSHRRDGSFINSGLKIG